jgi:hypothetical protein
MPDSIRSPSKGKKLLEQVSDALRAKHYSYRTEQTYIDLIKHYIISTASAISEEWAKLKLCIIKFLPD